MHIKNFENSAVISADDQSPLPAAVVVVAAARAGAKVSAARVESAARTQIRLRLACACVAVPPCARGPLSIRERCSSMSFYTSLHKLRYELHKFTQVKLT